MLIMRSISACDVAHSSVTRDAVVPIVHGWQSYAKHASRAECRGRPQTKPSKCNPSSLKTPV